MFLTTLGLAALVLEALAWIQIGFGGDGELPLAVFLLFHGGASAALAMLLATLLPPAYAHPRGAVVGLMTVVAFFVPGFGMLGLPLALLAVAYLPRLAPAPPFRDVVLPPLDPHERHRRSLFSLAGARSLLSNVSAPVAARQRALVTLSNVTPRVAAPMLRELLGDPVDDLRLIAYGMLDNQEKHLNAEIHSELSRFNRMRNRQEVRQAAYRLAHLYWELVYQGLVQGDLQSFAVQQASRFTEIAIADRREDGSLRVQYGKLLQLQGRIEEARLAYEEALKRGVPPTRVIPFIAELAFETKDLPEVRRLIGGLADWHNLPRLQPLIRYWIGSTDTATAKSP